MFKKKIICFLVAVCWATPLFAQEDQPVSKSQFNTDSDPSPEVAPGAYGKLSYPVTSKFNLSIGGFVKLDYVYNSTNLGTNGALGTLQPNGIPKSSSPAGKQEQSLFTARQSRLWFKVAGPTFLGAKTAALVETDFYGSGGTNEAGNLRMRHAFGTLDWENTQILFGQFTDTFAPASTSTLDFGLGATAGNPTQPRVTQIKLTQKIKLTDKESMKLSFAIQNPVQDQNLQTGAVADSSGSMVNMTGQAMFMSKSLGSSPGFWGMGMNQLQAGFFGLYGNQKVGGNRHAIDSWGYGFYTFVPIIASKDDKSRVMTLGFEGQAYMASNMAFDYATAAAQVGSAGNKTGAKGYGIYGQLMFYPTQNLGITAGYGKRAADDYKAYSLNSNFQKYSSNIYGNLFYTVSAAITVAGEYQYLDTKYGNVTNSTGNLTGTSDYGKANVFRCSVFYHF